MRPIIALVIILTVASCSSQDEKIEVRLTETNLIDNVELLVTKELQFEDVSITYNDLLKELSTKTKKQFLKEGGEVYDTLLPKWKLESESLLKTLCSKKSIKILEQNLFRRRQTGNLIGYDGRIKFECGDQTKNLKIAALKVDNQMYVCLLKEIPPGVIVR